VPDQQLENKADSEEPTDESKRAPRTELIGKVAEALTSSAATLAATPRIIEPEVTAVTMTESTAAVLPQVAELGAATPAATPEPPRSKSRQILRKAADEIFPDGWDHLPTSTIRAEAGKHRDVKALKSGTSRESWQRALGRRKD
jgi:hypothetical protein